MTRALVLFLGLAAEAAPRIEITLDASAPRALSGRLFVLMSDSAKDEEILRTGFEPGSSWIAAMEVRHLGPGKTWVFDADALTYPGPFSQAKPGRYQFMALLDPDHSYPYTGQNAGDWYGPVVRVKDWNPGSGEAVRLTLSKAAAPPPALEDTESVKQVEFESPLLTAFWGRPVTMRAGVVLPPGYAQSMTERYPAVYVVHGFGGNHRAAWRYQGGKGFAAVRVFLDGSFPTGHHEFADSVNNGPWGRALIEEFIPYLEGKFRLASEPRGRLLTGHSSGGWSTLWLQVTYPEFFGGTWSTAPDPVDMRSFSGVDASAGSTDNAYRRKDGTPHPLVRGMGSFEAFARQERVQGEYGGQLASFEWVWSPRGPDGRPMRLFDRETGDLDAKVAKAWERYDIRLILENNWKALEPKLRGKIHVVCGSEDTFYLNEATEMLCGFFKRVGAEAGCEMVPGRTHMNLYNKYTTYPDGLAARIEAEMKAAWDRRRIQQNSLN